MKNVWQSSTLRLPLMGVLPACLVGIGIMRLHGAPWSMPIMNLGAVIVGVVLIALTSSVLATWTSKRPGIVAGLVLAICALSLFAEGLQGVHRWVRVGPIRLHPVAMGLPLVLLAIVWLWEQQKTALAIATIVTGLALLVVQPDAGEATSLAAAVVALACISDKRYGARFVLVILAVLGTAAAWMRPDPLPPVDLVENIVPRAFAMHLGLGIAAIVALGMLPGAALVQVVQSPTNRVIRTYGASLAAYFVASIVAVVLGEFPTPVLGFGTSPILGAILGLGLLGAQRNIEDTDLGVR